MVRFIDLNAPPLPSGDKNLYEDCMPQPLDSVLCKTMSESSMIAKEPNRIVNSTPPEEALQRNHANYQDIMCFIDLNAPPLPSGDKNLYEDCMPQPLDSVLCKTMSESSMIAKEPNRIVNSTPPEEALQRNHANYQGTMCNLDLNAPPSQSGDENTYQNSTKQPLDTMLCKTMGKSSMRKACPSEVVMSHMDLNAPSLPRDDGNSYEDCMRQSSDLMFCERMSESSMILNGHSFLNASLMKEVLQKKHATDEDNMHCVDLNVPNLFNSDDTPYGRVNHVQQSSTIMHNLYMESYKTMDDPMIIDEPNSSIIGRYGAFDDLNIPFNAFKHFDASSSSTTCHPFDSFDPLGMFGLPLPPQSTFEEDLEPAFEDDLDNILKSFGYKLNFHCVS